MKKTLQPTNDLFIQFTEDELKTLNIEPGDKFDFKLQNDGSVKLEKYVKLELDMEEWPREALEYIIKESCEQDITVNDIIVNLLEKAVRNLKDNNLKSEYGYTECEAVLPTAWNNGNTYSTDNLPSYGFSNLADSSSFKMCPSCYNSDTSIAGDYRNEYKIENDMLYNG
jgi:hypothetical protein